MCFHLWFTRIHKCSLPYIYLANRDLILTIYIFIEYTPIYSSIWPFIQFHIHHHLILTMIISIYRVYTHLFIYLTILYSSIHKSFSYHIVLQSYHMQIIIYLFSYHQCLQLDITHFSVIFIFSIFMKFSKEVNKIFIHLFIIAGPGQFSWKFSLLSGRYTDISITNCNTVFTTSCRLTTRGFTRCFRRCWATTEIHFHVFNQSACTFYTCSVIFSNPYSLYNFV